MHMYHEYESVYEYGSNAFELLFHLSSTTAYMYIQSKVQFHQY